MKPQVTLALGNPDVKVFALDLFKKVFPEVEIPIKQSVFAQWASQTDQVHWNPDANTVTLEGEEDGKGRRTRLKAIISSGEFLDGFREDGKRFVEIPEGYEIANTQGRLNVYLPAELNGRIQRAKDKGVTFNLSQICQEAITELLDKLGL